MHVLRAFMTTFLVEDRFRHIRTGLDTTTVLAFDQQNPKMANAGKAFVPTSVFVIQKSFDLYENHGD